MRCTCVRQLKVKTKNKIDNDRLSVNDPRGGRFQWLQWLDNGVVTNESFQREKLVILILISGLPTKL